MATSAVLSARLGALRTKARGHGPLIILVVVLVFALLRYRNFYNLFNVSAILSSTDLLCIGLMAIGLTFVIAAGEIDLSVAGVAVCASVVTALLAPLGAPVAVLAGIAVGIVLGLANGILVSFVGLPSFIVTLAMLLATRGLSLILADRGRVPVDYSFPLVTFYSTKLWGLVPLPLLVVVGIAVIAGLVLSRSPFGIHVLAIGGDRESAVLMGLKEGWIRCAIFVITGSLSGLAGVFLLAKTTTGNPLEAQGWELTAIAAVVLGGTLLSGGRGSIASTSVGVGLLAIVFQILNYENGQGIPINSYWQNVIRGVFVLAIVIVQAVGARADQRRRAVEAARFHSSPVRSVQ
jgi:Ribose/xylose/arabinose/galactoside ABC-type transport systems, permease components